MGLFKTLFGGSGETKVKKVLPWITLNTIEQLDDIIEASKVKSQLIFKYSTRCGVSRMVLNQFVDTYDLSEDDIDLYFLDLINYRKVSSEVGYKFQVMHESPQVILIKNEVVAAHASHGQINRLDLKAFV